MCSKHKLPLLKAVATLRAELWADRLTAQVQTTERSSLSVSRVTLENKDNLKIVLTSAKAELVELCTD